MTREERNDAIEFFKKVKEKEVDGARYSRLAIEALEQEPCADMVSRDAMWDVLQRLYGTEGELVEELMSLPPVLPMPKMGRWIEHEVDIAPHPLHCSICGFSNHHISNRYIKEFRRCPNCGAEMEGEE